MAGSPRRWIRLDVGWQDSEWLYDLEPAARLAWPLLLDYVKSSGIGGSVKALSLRAAAKRWRLPEGDVAAMLEAGAAGDDPALELHDGIWIVRNWDEYQRPDKDQAAERKRRQRSRKVTDGHAGSRVTVRDRGQSRVTLSRDTDTYTNKPPPTPDGVGSPTTPTTPSVEAVTLLGNGGAEALEALKPKGGIRAALASICNGFLYEFDDQSTARDPSVKGLPLPERRELVARALVDMWSNGWGWSAPGLAGNIRKLRYQPPARDAPSNGCQDLTKAQFEKYKQIRAALEEGGMDPNEAAEEADRRART